mmetsp:Transcript_30341/g.116376  ORF Transcript_30341/g.116376 Transcript_30341/m.116376 type:complete len:291 (-) Transcript_30341:1013-1885(-)
MGFVGVPGGMRWKFAGVPRISRMGLRTYRMLSTVSGLAGSDVNMFRAKHILLSSKDMAESCQIQVASGAKFGDVAKSISQCPSKDRGGDLGWFRAGTMASGFEKACREAAVGDTVVAETEFGWHVIQVDGKANYPKSMTVQELSELYNNQELRENYQLIDVREVSESGCSPHSRMVDCRESDRCPFRLLPPASMVRSTSQSLSTLRFCPCPSMNCGRIQLRGKDALTCPSPQSLCVTTVCGLLRWHTTSRSKGFRMCTTSRAVSTLGPWPLMTTFLNIKSLSPLHRRLRR